jgi:molybdopterin molybdotransferase
MEGHVLDLRQAVRALTQHLPSLEARWCEVDKCLGARAATDLRAPADVPAGPIASGDGFLLPPGGGAGVYRIAGRFSPSEPIVGWPAAGETFRVEEGTAAPPDSHVVPVTKAEIIGTDMVMLGDPEPGLIAHAGHRIKEGSIVLAQGERITPAAWALLAAGGIRRVRVAVCPIVCVISVGTELDSPGRPEVTGRFMTAFVNGLGLPAQFLGVVPDAADRIRTEVIRALPAGFLFLCGGTGRGLTDQTLFALRAMELRILGEGINLRPGGTTAVAAAAQTVCVLVPGDPEAACAVAQALVEPAVTRWLRGRAMNWPPGLRIPLAEPWSGDPDYYHVVSAAIRGRTAVIADRRGKGGLLGAEGRLLLVPGAECRTEGFLSNS